MLNIGGDQSDRSYRYKMPKLLAKVEGRGNGIKTRIPNCAEIASALHRSPAVVTKFFGCELGAQSKWDEKEQSCIVNGEHGQNVLQAKLCDEFIPKFVLCSNCGLPETDMKVRKEMVRFQCAACGSESFADMTHKLCTFILKEGTGKKDKKEKKEKKSSKKDEPEKTEKKEKKEKKDKKDKKSKKSSKKDDDSDDIEWYTDISAEAVEARRLEGMTGGIADLVADIPAENDVNNSQPSPPEDDCSASDEDRSGSEEDKSSDPEVCDPEPCPEESQAALNIDPAIEAALSSLTQAFEGLSKQKEVSKVLDAEGGQILVDANLTAAQSLELLTLLPDNLAKCSALVLKFMYDHDIAEESDIVAWHENADQSLLAVSKATAFVDWLTQAESD